MKTLTVSYVLAISMILTACGNQGLPSSTSSSSAVTMGITATQSVKEKTPIDLLPAAEKKFFDVFVLGLLELGNVETAKLLEAHDVEIFQKDFPYYGIVLEGKIDGKPFIQSYILHKELNKEIGGYIEIGRTQGYNELDKSLLNAAISHHLANVTLSSNEDPSGAGATGKKASEDLISLYKKVRVSVRGAETFSEVASDGSYIKVDTNPYDLSNYHDEEAVKLIEALNKELNLPESVRAKMGTTRLLDGVQTHQGEGILVSWTYNPNNGLAVFYEKSK